MKVFALFGLILISASSFAIDGAGMPVGPGAPTEGRHYFMKLSPSDTECTYDHKYIEYSNKFYVQSKSSRQQISKVISTTNDRIKDLVLQCENAKRQVLQDTGSLVKSYVIINVQTGEVYPEKGFLIKREAVELERQKVQ